MPLQPGTSQIATLSTIEQVRDALGRARRSGATVGFVPTMGYLHDGHASLMRAARSDAQDDGVVIASIFVNPLQFAPDEDLANYPSALSTDTAVAQKAGVNYLFVPSVEEMYPGGRILTTVSVSGLSEEWDGASRPTHFAGVATVVNKLFNIIGPCRAYFGQKDFQQLAIIKRMVDDLSLPVSVVGCPIVREPSGLAMSSRNTYLSTDEREAAIVLKRALDAGATAVAGGEKRPAAVEAAMKTIFAAETRARLDYIAVVDPATLRTPSKIGAECRLLVAAFIGSTRLIDNCAATG